ncbi:MAG: hypothetical protein ACREYE_19140, partial [Gammaproteobacteria bacterium]
DIIKKIERARVKMEQIKPGSTLPRGKKEGGLTVKLFKGHYTSRGIYPEMAARRARQAAGERSGDGARILNEEVLALLQGVRAWELPTLA